MTLIEGLAIGMQAAKMWIEFQETLIARQKERKAVGKELSAAEVLTLIGETEANLKANRVSIVAAVAARQDAMRGVDD